LEKIVLTDFNGKIQILSHVSKFKFDALRLCVTQKLIGQSTKIFKRETCKVVQKWRIHFKGVSSNIRKWILKAGTSVGFLIYLMFPGFSCLANFNQICSENTQQRKIHRNFRENPTNKIKKSNFSYSYNNQKSTLSVWDL
jgi:hypothetical protein